MRKLGIQRDESLLDTVGCTMDELRIWLESQFKGGMTWENRGSIWTLDHIKPVTRFDLKQEDQRLQVNHFSNLRPLCKKENIRKGNRYFPALEILPFELKKALAEAKLAKLTGKEPPLIASHLQGFVESA